MTSIKKQPKIIIMGPQGSGKGTHAEIMEKKLGIKKITTGEIFRENIKKKTTLGVLANKVLNSGNIMPDEITNGIMAKELKKPLFKKGYILDGYPRTLVQAKFVDDISEPNFVILLTARVSLIMKRLSNRRECQECRAIYNLENYPPKKHGICDRCGDVLVVRKDDIPEIIKIRLKNYRIQTKPIIDYYKNKKILHVFDGEKPVEIIQKEIYQALKKEKLI